ncbi:MAG: hypothetical protein IKU20_07155 [Lachnospiraceae bacterium]|nr:hypothetical protein [Lachnospiraceae bacterium]
MGKIKYLIFIAMMIMVVGIVAACGRADNKSTTKAPMATTTEETTRELPSESYVNDVTNGEYGSTEDATYGNMYDESDGVLRDMVDDVERGINNVMDTP